MDTEARPTVRTISERAGVSASTVSRALKGDPRISRETTERILSIAKEESYTPNAIARSLVTRSSGVIGLVLGRLQNPFYAELMEQLHQQLVVAGKRPMLLHFGGTALDAATMQTVFQYQMDGCIIASAPISSSAAEVCARARLPMVMINRVARVHFCAVSCNNRAGGRLLGELLIQAGFRRIAFVAGREDTSTSEDREAGLKDALAGANLKLSGWARGHYTYEGGYEAGRELLACPAPPEAIFAANDIMALGVIDAARASGRNVPEDLSVVGFDNIYPAAWASYQLTTIAQPVNAMIARALELLAERMRDPSLPGEDVYIHGELKVRGSARLRAPSTGAA